MYKLVLTMQLEIIMPNIIIKGIYAETPDAKDEVNTEQSDKFFKTLVVPLGLLVNNLLDGKKFLISGYKGIEKTSIL